MNVETMRTRLIDMYPGSVGWTYRVSHMEDNQVIAIYLTRYEQRIKELKEGHDDLAVQLCMFEDIDKDRERQEWIKVYGDLYE